jgi:hypothetical protein
LSNYTIVSAKFANAAHTAALLMTEEAGAVLASERDTPELWAAMHAACLPSDYSEPEWRPAALTELKARRDRLMAVVSGMQVDYVTDGDTASAALCRDVKVGLKDIEAHSSIVAVLEDQQGTRAQFDAAVVARWKAIAAPAPVAVQIEFKRYAGGGA